MKTKNLPKKPEKKIIKWEKCLINPHQESQINYMMKHLSGDFHDKVGGLISVDGCMADFVNVYIPSLKCKKEIYQGQYAVEYDDGNRDILNFKEIMKVANVWQRALLMSGVEEHGIPKMKTIAPNPQY